MARRFTLRQNGQQMTTFRVRVDLTQAEIDDLLGRAGNLYTKKWNIEDVLEHCLTTGIERLTLDAALDPDQEDQD